MIPRVSILACCLAGIVILPACGGGGGTVARNVRATPPPAPPPPETAPTAPAHTSTGDVRVTALPGSPQGLNNVSTPGALVKEGGGMLSMCCSMRFDGGTLVSAGALSLTGNLFSDVEVQQGARLSVYDGNIVGDILMAGTFAPVFDDIMDGGFDYYLSWGNDIWGAYTQTSTGTLEVFLGVTKGVVAPLLDIHGVANLQGTLRVNADPVYVTSTGRSEWILRASGGVVGQFDDWANAGSLFIGGSLRYAPNDVFFDITRISVQAAMTASPFADAATLASAANLDRALEAADGFANLSPVELGPLQRQFLASAAAIQRIGDYAQAATTLDSLSGQAHASAQGLLLEQVAAPARQLGARLDRLRPGLPAGAWNQRGASVSGSSRAGHLVDGTVSGFDQWLGDGWLLGTSLGWNDSRMQFARHGGVARGDAPMGHVYLHHRDSRGAYFTGVAGYGRARLTLDRPLDLGIAGRRQAHSEREVSLAHVHAEAGRAFAAAGGRLTPFASMGYSALRSEGFAEDGNSGFELVVQPSREARLTGGIGMRYQRDWRFADERWLQFDFSGQYQQLFARDADPILAAFSGAPMAAFALDALGFEKAHGLLGFGLAGGRRDAWSWFLQHDRALQGVGRGDAWSAGLRFDF